MTVEHEPPFSAGDDEYLRDFLNSLETPIEPMNQARKILRRRGLVALSSAQATIVAMGLTYGDNEFLEEIQRNIAKQLNEYNEQRGILRLGDRLTFSGSLFVRVRVGEDYLVEIAEPNYHVSGAFSELVSMAAPPQERLLEADPDLFIDGQDNYIAGVRLKDAIVTETLGDFTEVKEYPDDCKVDVPLYLNGIDMHRLTEGGARGSG